MLKYTLFTILNLCLFLNTGYAQLSEGGTPMSDKITFTTLPPTITMPSINVEALMAEDDIDLANNNPLRFAFGHQVNLTLDNAGRWETIANGDRVWRLQIECPEALNINLLYNDFYLPKGAKLFLYNEAKTQILGAFTSANNKENRKFATALIHGDKTILEYFEPARSTGLGSISIGQVAHGYRSLDAEDTGSLGNSGDCQVNVNCDEGNDWQDQKKGVGKIVMDGLYLCSGNLINNTANDCKPYFLTANHCIMGGVLQDAIINPDVSGYIFYWNFEYQGCENSGFVSDAQTTNGGTVIANAGIAQTGMHTIVSSDFALIQLDENPRDQYDVYFNGWDASGVSGNTGVGIHHPAGDAKKISTHQVTPGLDGYYWALYWNSTANGHSVTEGGSSGSSLFRESGLVIGQLFGGGSVNCDDPANDLGLYGRLDYSWTNADSPDSFDARRRLFDWLDPIGNGTIRVLDGAYHPCDTRQVYFHEAAAIIEESAADTNDGCLAYKDYTYTIGITPFPIGTVTANLQSSGDALAGENRDYTIFPESVSFSGPFNQQSFTVRVYDDIYEEAAEQIQLTFTLEGDNVAPMPALSAMNITINSDDTFPNTHVQSVTNNPTTEYLGAFGKVTYVGQGTNGLMMTIENLSDVDFGCTTVEVDHSGANANNAWSTGSTTRKTFKVESEFAHANAPVRVSLYYTNSEVQGYEIFNAEGSNRNEISVIQFANKAILANENSATIAATSLSGYGSNHVFTGDFSELIGNSVGFSVGNLTNASSAFQGSINNGFSTNQAATTRMSLSPNPTTHQLKVEWNGLMADEITEINVMDVSGKSIQYHTVEAAQGFNQLLLNVSSFDDGIYFLQIKNESQEVPTQRFVKIQ